MIHEKINSGIVAPDLKPCPFCEGSVKFNITNPDNMTHIGERGCVFGLSGFPVEKWNRRRGQKNKVEADAREQEAMKVRPPTEAESYLTGQAIMAAAFWLDASPHERSEADGTILAKWFRYAMDRMFLLEQANRLLSIRINHPMFQAEALQQSKAPTPNPKAKDGEV